MVLRHKRDRGEARGAEVEDSETEKERGQRREEQAKWRGVERMTEKEKNIGEEK